MADEVLDKNQKAVRINLDASRYGTFAEIGAGQEVARCFFRAGHAAGTVAKTISAYDMAVTRAHYRPRGGFHRRERPPDEARTQHKDQVQHTRAANGPTPQLFFHFT